MAHQHLIHCNFYVRILRICDARSHGARHRQTEWNQCKIYCPINTIYSLLRTTSSMVDATSHRHWHRHSHPCSTLLLAFRICRAFDLIALAISLNSCCFPLSLRSTSETYRILWLPAKLNFVDGKTELVHLHKNRKLSPPEHNLLANCDERKKKKNACYFYMSIKCGNCESIISRF